jgi:hypothetical protein
MPLLTDDLRTRLPPLLSQEAEGDPMVYARFHLPGTRWAWYVGISSIDWWRCVTPVHCTRRE